MQYIQKASNSGDASGTTVDVTVSATGAGRLLVCWTKWEGTSGSTVTVAEGVGGTAFSPGTLRDSASQSDLHGQFFYLLSSTGGQTTIRATWASARTFRRLHVWEFSYTGTVVLDTQITNDGVAFSDPTVLSSGNIATTATDEVIVGGYGEYSGDTVSSPQVNSVAADQSIINSPAGSFAASWERIVTAPFTGAATISLASSGARAWILNAIAFKVAQSSIDTGYQMGFLR